MNFLKSHICIILLFLFWNHATVFAQSASSVELSFVKQQELIESGKPYFNVLRMVNTSDAPIDGEVIFQAPLNWNILSFPEIKTLIAPRDTSYVPIRISPPSNVLGDVSYILGALFKTKHATYRQSAVLRVPAVTEWRLAQKLETVLVTINKPNGEFKVHVSNLGNTPEVIQLSYELGKLVYCADFGNVEQHREYIELGAKTDTILTYAVAMRNDLDLIERYEQNWQESAINIVATASNQKQNTRVYVRNVDYHYEYIKPEPATPLNIDYSLRNIMSKQDLSHQLRLYGTTLIPDGHQFKYYAGVNNFQTPFNSNFDINKQVIYDLYYSDSKGNWGQLSYNINNSTLHYMNGRGLRGEYSIAPKHRLDYSVIQNPYTNSLGGNVGYKTRFGDVNFNTSVVGEGDFDGGYWSASVQLGASMRFLKKHNLGLQVLTSVAKYTEPTLDTLGIGASLQLNYSFIDKDWNIHFNGRSNLFNKIRNAGTQTAFLNAQYRILPELILNLNANSQFYTTTRYPKTFDTPISYYSNNNARLTAAYHVSPRGVLQAGPTYFLTSQQSLDVDLHTSTFIGHQPGAYLSYTQMLRERMSLTPNLTIGGLLIEERSSNPLLPKRELDKGGLFYTLGLNFYSENWKLNAYYSMGSMGDMMRDREIYGDDVRNTSVQLRPMYECDVFSRKGRIIAAISYAYYLQSQRQIITTSLQYEHSFKYGWQAYTNIYLYSNLRRDENNLPVSSNSLNAMVGFRKAINIQQPRVKYHDYKAVLFNDIDGDRQKSEDEPPVSNVLVEFAKDRDVEQSAEHANLPNIQLVTNLSGEVLIDNMPEGKYKLSLTALENDQNLYFLEGEDQSVSCDDEKVMYIPLGESYKIRGKIIVSRDPNSSKGDINLESIRVTATTEGGEVYSALTGKDGSYIIAVPRAAGFWVEVTNVFGPDFMTDTRKMFVQFYDSKTMQLDFTFAEKRRKINFSGGNLMNNFP